MEVRFNDKSLAIVETDSAHKTKLPPEVVLSVRRKIRFMREAKDVRDLRSWKSLHFEKLNNNPDGEYSIRANNQWRIVFDIDESCQPTEINIKAIKDYH
jgi:proteic killer suppression protein